MRAKPVDPVVLAARLSEAEDRARLQADSDPNDANFKLYHATEASNELQQLLGSDFEVSAKPAKRGIEFIVRPIKQRR